MIALSEHALGYEKRVDRKVNPLAIVRLLLYAKIRMRACAATTRRNIVNG